MSRSSCAAFIALYCCVALFCLLTPLISDDYYFGSSATQPFAAIMAGEPVQSFGSESLADVVRRAVQIYTSWDGRIAAYATFGFYLWLPQSLYALLIAGVFCGTVFLALLHVVGPEQRARLTPFSIGLMAAALWWGLPTCGSIYFWRTGLAYAMDLLCALLFLLPFRQLLEQPDLRRCKAFSPAATAGYLLLSLYFGLLQFNTPILCLLAGVAATCRLWFLNAALPAGERLRRLLPLICGLCVLLAGICIIFSSPGNAQRVQLRAEWFLSLTLWDKALLWLLEQPRVQMLFWLPWLLTGWALTKLICRYGRAFWRYLPPLGVAFLLLGQMGQGAYLFAPHPDSRAYSSVFLFMLLGGCLLARAALAQVPPADFVRARRLSFCFFFLVLLTLPHELSLFISGGAELEARDGIYAASAGKHVRVAPLKTRGDRFFVLGAYQQDIAYDPDFWINQVVARRWELASVALEMPPDRVFSLTTDQGQIAFCLRGETLRLLSSPSAAGNYYVYYYGKPGLVRYLPASLADRLTRWLQQARPGDMRLCLVPLFYARARLKSGDTAPVPLWGPYAVEDPPLWLVRPGDGPTSLRLLPLLPES